MRKLIVCFIALFLAFAINANAAYVPAPGWPSLEPFLHGEGWAIDGFKDTSVGNEDRWLVASPGSSDHDFGDFRYQSSYLQKAGVATIHLEDSGNLTPGLYTATTQFITYFTEDSLPSIAKIAFKYYASTTFGQVFVDGEKVLFEKMTSQEGWFEMVLTQPILSKLADGNNKPHELTFAFDVPVNTTGFDFGIMFDSSNSEIRKVAPEPATLAILGLGLLGLPLARRFRRK